ncbi:MAG: lysoplasmalogenase [Anaerolineae bacterium]|nr:lysoplasmalogenase [Anaerolineae bacterium]MDW8099355.1 lysoplasmalogenase [Anaerolineae bacterium]
MIHLVLPPHRLWMLALQLLWAAFLFGGFFFGRSDAHRTRRMPTWTRIASSLTLVAAGWSWYWLARERAVGDYAMLIGLGMTFGFLGDLFMARLLPMAQPVIGGIVAFGLGHMAYIAAFLSLARRSGLTVLGPLGGAWAIWLGIGLLGWYWAVFRGQRLTALRWAALPYVLLLASVAGVTTGLAWQDSAFLSLALGGALFLVSDLILAAQLFSGWRFPFIGDVIWLTYGPAQMWIVYSVDSAWRVWHSYSPR